MEYPYVCKNCEFEFLVVKSVADIDNIEPCQKCTSDLTVRTIARQQSFSKIAAGDWNRKEFNPAFGKAVTPIEAGKEAKRRGWVEVGNEDPNKIEKSFAKDRAKKAEYKSIPELTGLGEIRTK